MLRMKILLCIVRVHDHYHIQNYIAKLLFNSVIMLTLVYVPFPKGQNANY